MSGAHDAPEPYVTGPDHPDAEPYYWVRCLVSVPGQNGTASEVRLDAKVECSDVVDALDLDRWSTQAFQYLWRCGRKPGQHVAKELAKAQWFINRSVHTFHGDWQAGTCDTVARVLDTLLERFPADQIGPVMMALSRDLRGRDPRAVALVADAYADELARQTPAPLAEATSTQEPHG